MGSELRSPVYQGDGLGDRLQHQRPVDSRVAAADDNHVKALIHGWVWHEMNDSASQELFTHRQGPRREGSDPAGDDDRSAFDAATGRSGYGKAAVAAFQAVCLLAQPI